MQKCANNRSTIVLAEIAQLVEQRHGKAQVVGSIPTLGSSFT
jgi:hypothetical protein